MLTTTYNLEPKDIDINSSVAFKTYPMISNNKSKTR